METFSELLDICAGNSLVPGEFPTQRPVTRSFDVFFDQRLNKRLSKQSWGWWLETLSRPLWRHCNVLSKSVSVTVSDFSRASNPCKLVCQNRRKNTLVQRTTAVDIWFVRMSFLLVSDNQTIEISNHGNTVECHYNAVQYCKMLHW